MGCNFPTLVPANRRRNTAPGSPAGGRGLKLTLKTGTAWKHLICRNPKGGAGTKEGSSSGKKIKKKKKRVIKKCPGKKEKQKRFCKDVGILLGLCCRCQCPFNQPLRRQNTHDKTSSSATSARRRRARRRARRQPNNTTTTTTTPTAGRSLQLDIAGLRAAAFSGPHKDHVD